MTRRRALILGGLLVLALLAAGAWLARADAGRLPPAVAIEGRDLGGRPLAEARTQIRGLARERLERTIVLVAPGERVEISGDELGAEPAIEEALDEARNSRGPLSRLAARLGLASTIEIPLEYRLERETLASVLDAVAEEVERMPAPARVELIDGDPEVVEAEPGRRLERGRLAALLEDLPTRVALPLRSVPPSVTTAAAEEARDLAAALIREPPDVVRGDRRLELRPRLIRSALTFEAKGSEIEVSLEPDELGGALRGTFGDLERDARDASLRVRGEDVEVVEARRGRRLDAERVARELVENHGANAVRARFERLEPRRTTAEVEALGIRTLVSEFTTEYACCPPRVTNIQRGAEILDGTIVPAGGRFSLNEAMGERTRGRGFVRAPMILAGRLVDSVGGGVSQIATTVYNAAFFAGVNLVAHTPHQFYIPRYPMGREATISWGGPELIFENDWDAAILVKAEAGSTAISVRFYSSELGRRVETETDDPRDFRPPENRTIPDDSLAPGKRRVVQEAGEPGFSVSYTRRVYKGDELRRDERFSVRYDPQHRIVAVGRRRDADE